MAEPELAPTATEEAVCRAPRVCSVEIRQRRMQNQASDTSALTEMAPV
jgi:hypothetical protein